MSGNERRGFAQREIDRAVRAATVTVRRLGPGDDPVRVMESPHDPHPHPHPEPESEYEYERETDPGPPGRHPEPPGDPGAPRLKPWPGPEIRSTSVLADDLGFNLGAPPRGGPDPAPSTPSAGSAVRPPQPPPQVPRPRRPARLNLLIERFKDRLPVTLQGRWRLDRRTGTALAAVVAVAAVVLGGWTLFRAQSRQVGGPQLVTVGRPARPSPGGMSPAAAPIARTDGNAAPNFGAALQGAPPADLSTATGIVVDVEGKVAKPGVIHLPAGSRVMDALHAAGGALPGTDLVPLNQARVLNDGEQVLVGAPAGSAVVGGSVNGAGPAAAAHSGGKAPPPGPVHLNTATADQLEQLPGVGPAMAQRIIDWRAQHGSFSSVTELQQVKGLGPAKFAALRQWVTP
ncbi:MAG: helix-hairpin-helix domain-containing protein [Actinocrinis sp.]